MCKLNGDQNAQIHVFTHDLHGKRVQGNFVVSPRVHVVEPLTSFGQQAGVIFPTFRQNSVLNIPSRQV
jgi:hypothetical protein